MAWWPASWEEMSMGFRPWRLLNSPWRRFKTFFHRLGSPYRFRDYGIPREAIPRLVEGGMKHARLFVINPRDLTEQDVRSVYEEAY